jgi:hypothetical protein
MLYSSLLQRSMLMMLKCFCSRSLLLTALSCMSDFAKASGQSLNPTNTRLLHIGQQPDQTAAPGGAARALGMMQCLACAPTVAQSVSQRTHVVRTHHFGLLSDARNTEVAFTGRSGPPKFILIHEYMPCHAWLQ